MPPVGEGRSLRRVVVAVALLGALAVAAAALATDDPVGTLRQWFDQVLEATRGLPAPLFFLALALLPLTAVPIVPLYLLAGASYGFAGALLGIALVLPINLALSLLLARKLRAVAEHMVTTSGYRVPRIPEGEEATVILLVRVTPGAPLMLQNLLLGMAGVPAGRFLLISWVTEVFIAAGYLMAGDSVDAQSPARMVGGVGLIIAVVLAMRLVRRRLKARAQSPEADVGPT